MMNVLLLVLILKDLWPEQDGWKCVNNYVDRIRKTLNLTDSTSAATTSGILMPLKDTQNQDLINWFKNYMNIMIFKISKTY